MYKYTVLLTTINVDFRIFYYNPFSAHIPVACCCFFKISKLMPAPPHTMITMFWSCLLAIGFEPTGCCCSLVMTSEYTAAREAPHADSTNMRWSSKMIIASVMGLDLNHHMFMFMLFVLHVWMYNKYFHNEP